MNLYETIFILQFVMIVIITLMKLYNVMSIGTERKINEKDTSKDYPLWYDMKLSFILFIAVFIIYGAGFLTFLADYTEILYQTLFKLETMLLMLNSLFFIIELFLNLSGKYSNLPTQRQAYRPSRE